MSAYSLQFFKNLDTYASTGALSAIDTSNYLDGERAIVTGTGMYQFHLNSADGLSGTTIIAAGGNNGNWQYVTEPYLIMSDSNIIDASQVQNSPGDIALANAHILVGNASNLAADVALTGDIAITNTGVSSIAAGVIVNADINASAAIDYSKLAALTSGNMLVGSAGNVATSVAMSGDATMANTGAVTIAANAVTTAKILNSNVTLAKLAAGITPSDIAVYSGKITWSGSGASLTTAVSGVLATDKVMATIQGAPTQAAYLVSAAPGTDQIVLTLSDANTSNNAVIAYTVFRTAA